MNKKTYKKSGGTSWRINRHKKKCNEDSVTPYISTAEPKLLYGSILDGNNCSNFINRDIDYDGDKIRVDNCNDILYKEGSGLNTKFHYCRKSNSKTGLCGKYSQHRKLKGTCINNEDLLLEDYKIKKGKHLTTQSSPRRSSTRRSSTRRSSTRRDSTRRDSEHLSPRSKEFHNKIESRLSALRRGGYYKKSRKARKSKKTRKSKKARKSRRSRR
jgi:hypothetical protein